MCIIDFSAKRVRWLSTFYLSGCFRYSSICLLHLQCRHNNNNKRFVLSKNWQQQIVFVMQWNDYDERVNILLCVVTLNHMKVMFAVKCWLQSLAHCHRANRAWQSGDNYCTTGRRAQPWQRIKRAYFAHTTVQKDKSSNCGRHSALLNNYQLWFWSKSLGK